MHFTQRIGNTVYKVNVTVNESGDEKDTYENHILRLIRNADCDTISVSQRNRCQPERKIV